MRMRRRRRRRKRRRRRRKRRRRRRIKRKLNVNLTKALMCSDGHKTPWEFQLLLSHRRCDTSST